LRCLPQVFVRKKERHLHLKQVRFAFFPSRRQFAKIQTLSKVIKRNYQR